MTQSSEKPLVIAISSRALFNMTDSHEVFTKQGVDAYQGYQIERENETLEPGVAFRMVKKFLAINDLPATSHNNNDKTPEHDHAGQSVEIVLLSRNSADTSLRVFNSIEHHGLDITRAVFTSGQSPYPYIKALGADLFLSADPSDVRKALDIGYAAATILPSQMDNKDSGELKIAFDGDAVLFSDEAEKVFQKQGLDAFSETEKQAADQPLPGGPFKNVLAALQRIQQSHPQSPIRTALITARGAPAHERVIKTLRAWDIRIDESFFLAGKDKGEFLRIFNADIFFDDQKGHCESAQQHVPTGHVPSGIRNQ